MRNSCRFLLFALFALCLSAVLAPAHTGARAAERNDIGLVTLDGNIAYLEDRKVDGKWLVVMVWATTCGICAREVPLYSDFHDAHKNDDIEILGIALDGIEQKGAIKDTMARWDMRFPTLVADLGVYAVNYEAQTGESLYGTPTFIVYDRKGQLVANNPGPMRTTALVNYIARRDAGR